ncbi:hypothetical protein DDZ13_06015 [Coraliomargarita sinensis]|uniref:Uncharacterized protein n=1 Tax=Coraliomargarita sinensis TaxID=2174842 RepID=A0A317ZGJ1_9BACT|nr:hypothetical protein [Coraliomargarita sinensis]PXA04725.1 hypothetical protein DDZ13_06015 [Coraliomargarita sinensis]
MRFNLKKTPAAVLAASMALVCSLNAQSEAQNFRIKEPIPVTNQDGQKIMLVGMQGNSVTFQFAGMEGAEASIPIKEDSQIRLTYSYPDNFSDIQLNVLNGNYDQALRSIRNPPIDLLRFLVVPESNCNFHLYSEIYYRALVYAGAPQVAVEATSAIPWNSPSLPPVFVDHASTLLERMVNEKRINFAEDLLNTLQKGLSVAQFSNLALPVADKLRLLGENEIVESIYNVLSQSSDETMRKLGRMWTAYNLANTGSTDEAKRLLNEIGEVTEESPLFSIYCLAQGRLALSEENSVQALRYLSRAMVRTTIADSYKPEIYFLMIQSYMMDKNKVPASRLAKEMAVFYPNNMWRKSIINRFPEIEQQN